MRTLLITFLFVCASLLAGPKKVTSTTTTASNEQADLEATITMDEAEVKQAIGDDPGKGIVLLKVKVTPKTDKPLYVSPDDFILLANDDGERHKPFTAGEIAGSGAMVVTATKGAQKKTSMMSGLGGMMGGGGGSPGNSQPVNVQAKMDDKKAGDNKLLEELKAKALPTKESIEPIEGYLYFQLDGKHKLKNLEVLYRGAAGKLNMSFVQ